MNSLAHTQLVLRGVDLTTNTDTQNGSANALRTVLTWKNINLRTTLGALYDKYDTFNLCLSCVVSDHPSISLINGNVATFGLGDSTNLINMIYIGGLPFINSTYSQISSHNTSQSFCGVFTYPSQVVIANNYNVETSVAYKIYNTNTIITFGKSQEQADITISLLRAIDFTPPQSAVAFPATNFVFDIVGCDKKDDFNGGRLF